MLKTLAMLGLVLAENIFASAQSEFVTTGDESNNPRIATKTNSGTVDQLTADLSATTITDTSTSTSVTAASPLTTPTITLGAALLSTQSTASSLTTPTTTPRDDWDNSSASLGVSDRTTALRAASDWYELVIQLEKLADQGLRAKTNEERDNLQREFVPLLEKAGYTADTYSLLTHEGAQKAYDVFHQLPSKAVYAMVQAQNSTSSTQNERPQTTTTDEKKD